MLGAIKGHTLPANSAAFSPDNELVISCLDDETVRIWDSDTQLERGILKLSVALRTVRFSCCGQYIETDRGVLAIGSILSTATSSASQNPRSALFVSKDWVVKDGEQVLWLPDEYHASCAGTQGSSVTMGHATGGVSFVQV